MIDDAILANVNKFSFLDDRRRELEEELKQVKEEMSGIEASLVEFFLSTGTRNVKLMNGKTVYLRTELWLSLDPEKKLEAIEALRSHEDTSFLVDDRPRVNSSKLSAWGRELVRDPDGGLPQWVEPYLKVTEKTSIRCTKGG